VRALALGLILLAGCGGGPDAEALKADVEARLAQALPAGTVSIAGFQRRGSQSDTKAPAGETRRILYFDADLKLERDFDFGAWDAPGVAGLVSALGAGPKGISGITSGGNKAGDVLRAHGTALYRRDAGRDADRWVGAAPAGHRPTEAPAYATGAPPDGPAAILDSMRKVVDSISRDAAPGQIAAVEEELVLAYATIRARVARAKAGYAVAAGPEHGQYLRFARALADASAANIVPLVTLGGEQNLRMLRERKVSLALAQADAALDAYEGAGSFKGEGVYAELRAIGSLYPEPVHVLVRADDAAATAGDLRGRVVAIGLPGSASRTTAVRVLEAHGLSLEDVKPRELALGEALVGLQQKTVDAVIQVIGMPADSVRDALAAVPLRLLPLSERAVASLVAGKSPYFAYSIPPGAYATQAKEARTIATAALLLASADLADSEIAALTRFVFERGHDLAARGSAQGAQVSAATARQGLAIPQHLPASKALSSP
jgi:TRAP transporter TAXI family solute receptor